MTEKTLDGRIALVTGASRGIGAATAEALAAAGAHVIITARTAAGLEEVEERVHQAGGSATIAPLDLIDGDSIGRLAQAVTERWGKLDILVLNAAMLGTLTPVVDIDPKELAKVLTLNVGAQQALLAAFDPLLRNSDSPRVIALTSRLGTVPTAFWGAYGASKAALDNLLLAYAAERRQVGNARVAIVDPGATATKMRARAFPGEDQSTLKGPEVVANAIVALATEDFETGYRTRVE